MQSDSEYILNAIRRIPVEPDTVKRSALLDGDVPESRRVNLQSKIYAFPEFVLVAEDNGMLCFLSEEAKQKSIDEYKRWSGVED